MKIFERRKKDDPKQDVINLIKNVIKDIKMGMVVERWNDGRYSIRNKNLLDNVFAAGVTYVCPDPEAKSIKFLVRDCNLLAEIEAIGNMFKRHNWTVEIEKDYIKIII